MTITFSYHCLDIVCMQSQKVIGDNMFLRYCLMKLTVTSDSPPEKPSTALTFFTNCVLSRIPESCNGFTNDTLSMSLPVAAVTSSPDMEFLRTSGALVMPLFTVPMKEGKSLKSYDVSSSPGQSFAAKAEDQTK